MEARECRECGSFDPVTLHNLPHQGAFAFLCTGCVLRHHPACFCPICFDIYEDTTSNKRPSNQSRVMCLRCPAMVHLACLPSDRSSSTFRYLCPQCSDPSFTFFDFRYASSGSKGSSAIFTSRDLPKQLLCAAKIASAFMHRAAAIARSNAEQKVREALEARKRAKEAIERVSYLMASQQTQDDSDLDDGSSGQ